MTRRCWCCCGTRSRAVLAAWLRRAPPRGHRPQEQDASSSKPIINQKDPQQQPPGSCAAARHSVVAVIVQSVSDLCPIIVQSTAYVRSRYYVCACPICVRCSKQASGMALIFVPFMMTTEEVPPPLRCIIAPTPASSPVRVALIIDHPITPGITTPVGGHLLTPPGMIRGGRSTAAPL